MVVGEHSLKTLAPQLLRFGVDRVLKIFSQRMNELINELINYKFDYRTALATPGLLKSSKIKPALLLYFQIVFLFKVP